MASIKALLKWAHSEDKQQVKENCCILTISVGQQYHEGDKFAATAELIASNFNSCILLVCDSLQRHTMAFNTDKSPDFFYDIAVNEGSLWLSRNQKYIQRIMPKEIYHWDKWLNHDSYFNRQDEILLLMKKDFSYKNIFDVAIDKYLSRYCKHLSNPEIFDMHKAKKLCFDYVVEECVVFSLWSELNCRYEIYPNMHNEAIQETRRRFVHSNNLQPLTIKFRNANETAPQKFYLLNEPQEAKTNQEICTI